MLFPHLYIGVNLVMNYVYVMLLNSVEKLTFILLFAPFHFR